MSCCNYLLLSCSVPQNMRTILLLCSFGKFINQIKINDLDRIIFNFFTIPARSLTLSPFHSKEILFLVCGLLQWNLPLILRSKVPNPFQTIGKTLSSDILFIGIITNMTYNYTRPLKSN